MFNDDSFNDVPENDIVSFIFAFLTLLTSIYCTGFNFTVVVLAKNDSLFVDSP